MTKDNYDRATLLLEQIDKIKSLDKRVAEKFISRKKSQKLICAVYERSIKHVYFIYEMF